MYVHIYAWCHKVEDNSTATTTAAAPTSPASQCEECREGENSAVCDVEHFPYTTCRYCRAGVCVPGACHVSIPSVHVSAVSVLVQAASVTSTAPRTTSVLTASAGRCHYLHTIYTLFTHYLHTIYTLSTQYLHTI